MRWLDAVLASGRLNVSIETQLPLLQPPPATFSYGYVR